MKNNFSKQKNQMRLALLYVLKCVYCLVKENSLSSTFLACANVWLKHMKKIWSHICGVGEKIVFRYLWIFSDTLPLEKW